MARFFAEKFFEKKRNEKTYLRVSSIVALCSVPFPQLLEEKREN